MPFNWLAEGQKTGLLDDPNESVRRTAIETLSGIEDPRALKPILKALKDPDTWVQEVSVMALGNIAKEKSLPLLYPLLKNKALKWTVLTTIINPCATTWTMNV